MTDWLADAILYHLYPLGALGAPTRNDFTSSPVSRLDGLHAWIESAADLGANVLYLGPVFESTAHGYDTADYFKVDRRLGDAAALAGVSEALHRRGMRLLLDGVFHHVGRDFWAFRDVQSSPDGSRYRDWFFLDRSGTSPYGDPFRYEGWRGHYDLVKLNVRHPDVRQHVFDAVRSWSQEFQIDGLRLDVADVLDLEFQHELASFGRSLRSDFRTLGEVIHGDYRRWVGPGRLDSVTNYELYKGLYSSHNDRNYFELAYSLNREFGQQGMYRGLPLCTFLDNHDLDRIASRLHDPTELYPLHILLFTCPGFPAIYYGSEWGLLGRKDAGDSALRPALTPMAAAANGAHPDLRRCIQRLAAIRHALPALRYGDYRELSVAHRLFAFERVSGSERVAIVVNASEQASELRLSLPGAGNGELVDALDGERKFVVQAGSATVIVPPRWGRILRWLPR